MGLFSSLTSFDNWFLESLDTFTEKMQGQFPTKPTENVVANYAQHNALNRQKPILQFLNGAADTVSFEVLLYARNAIESPKVEANLRQLKKWAKRDDRWGRPSILKFYVGDGHLEVEPCVITGLSGIKYEEPTITGAIRQVKLTINLVQFEHYDLDNISLGDTRYHRVKDRDYYEFLSYQEYGTPDFGDIIRKMHPTKPNIQVANIVKLPSRETISSEQVEQKSLQLQTAYGRKDTNQRRLRLETFDRTNRTYTSHIIKE